MKILVSRWKMCGGGLAYEVLVSEESAPFAAKFSGYRVNKEVDGRRANFILLVHAILPASHFKMLPGVARYQAYRDCELKARRLALDLAELVFPELSLIRARGFEDLGLWHNDLISPEPAGHFDFFIDADIAPNPGGVD